MKYWYNANSLKKTMKKTEKKFLPELIDWPY